ncbi:MAG: hypothetical protein ACRDO2_13420, partial [Nocardioidaceae bacterium]
MSASTMTRPRRLAVATVLALALVVTGCSGDDESDAGDDTTPTSTGPTVPEGITAPGETLAVGKAATVVFKGNAQHTSRIDLRVTQVRKGSVKDLKQFSLKPQTRRSSVYYVDTTVSNVGSGDLSGQSLTLYGKVSDELVVPPAVFGSPFARCNYHPFPQKFTKNKS